MRFYPHQFEHRSILTQGHLYPNISNPPKIQVYCANFSDFDRVNDFSFPYKKLINELLLRPKMLLIFCWSLNKDFVGIHPSPLLIQHRINHDSFVFFDNLSWKIRIINITEILLIACPFPFNFLRSKLNIIIDF